MIIYERMNLFKRIHYALYWLLLSTVLFLAWDIAGRIAGENKYLSFRLLMSYGGLGGIAVLFISIAHYFNNMVLQLDKILVVPAANYNDWVQKKLSEVFGFKHGLSKLLPIVFSLSVTFSVLIWFLPYQSKLLNILWILAIQPLLLISGHGAYCILAVLAFLSQISSYPVKVPFYRPNHPGMTSILFFYSYSTAVSVLCYIWLLLETRLGPYGFTSQPIIVTWLIIIGFFPLSMFAWSFLKVNQLARRIRQSHVDVINKEVTIALAKLRKEPTKENAETLSQIMDIQHRIESENVILINIESVLAFVAALIAPFGQTIISFLKRLLP